MAKKKAVKKSKKVLIDGILKRLKKGGQIVWERPEADGSFGYVVRAQDDVEGIEYAEGPICSLEDIALPDLAGILQDGQYGDEFDWEVACPLPPGIQILEESDMPAKLKGLLGGLGGL